jgi:glycosyltransferase involved in cell wall biosynthesis
VLDQLKVLLDYSPAYKPQKTGIPYFIHHLYHALEKIDDINLHKSQDISIYIPRKPYKFFRFFEKFLYHDLYLPFKLYFGKYDVFIETQYIFNPLFKPKNTLIVNFIYDIGLMLYDDIQTTKHTNNFRKKLAKSLQKSDLLITLSQSSQKDILHYTQHQLNFTPSIDYIYASTTTSYKCQLTKNELFNKFKISTDYFLFLGTLEPRKNPLATLKAFHHFKQKTKASTKLIFAGKKGWLYKEVLEYVEDHHLTHEVIFTGYITQEEKYLLLKEAKLFLFLSKYEGFGMPPLEALRLNTAVLLSDIPVFHELFGSNASYAPINDIKAISQKMQEALIQPRVILETSLKKFSWDLSAHKLIKILSKHHRLKYSDVD